MSILLVLVAIVAVVAVGGAVVAVAGAQRVKQNAQKGQQISPGTASAAPLGWAGAHTPEAKLHRRLVAAMGGLRSATGDDVMVMANVQVVERESLKIEQQLIAASQMADRLKGPAIDELAKAVDQIEEVSAQLIQRSAELSSGDVQAQLGELSERLELLDQARAELDNPAPPAPGEAADETGQAGS